MLEALRPMFKASPRFGMGGAPASRPCVELEPSLSTSGAAMPCASGRRTAGTREAIAGLVARGVLGCPDVLGQLQDGGLLEVEVKGPTGKLRCANLRRHLLASVKCRGRSSSLWNEAPAAWRDVSDAGKFLNPTEEGACIERTCNYYGSRKLKREVLC